jgi:hypothetical protein
MKLKRQRSALPDRAAEFDRLDDGEHDAPK